LTPGGPPETQVDIPGYVLPGGHVVQVFFAEEKLRTAIITTPQGFWPGRFGGRNGRADWHAVPTAVLVV
jgi:hypothetical protein